MKTIEERLIEALKELQTAKAMSEHSDIKCQIERVIVQLEIALSYEIESAKDCRDNLN